MSRSFKKTPISKDKNKSVQKLANRKVRQKNKVHQKYYHVEDEVIRSHDYIQNGKAYRFVVSPYDISDWLIHYSESEFKKDQLSKNDSDKRDLFDSWARYYKNK